MPIDTPEELRRHVELAIQVELSTIPPYLFAMYSIEDANSGAALLIRSIVVEEMLHAALATNLLLALGGRPRFEGTRYIPRYPMDLPHHRPPLRLDLAPCSNDVIENTFMRIEQPEGRRAPLVSDEYETLGQFYHALEQSLVDLSRKFDIFGDADEEAQMSEASFYRPVQLDAEESGGLIPINDVNSALEAIETIIHQGEGLSHEKWADPGHKELTHYHKLLEIHEGASALGSVIPLRENPTVGDYPGEVRVVADLFNALYRSVFLVMDKIFTGVDQGRAVGLLYLFMGSLLPQVARCLTGYQLEDGKHAAPTFEVYEFGDSDVIAELAELTMTAAANHPELTPVHNAITGLDLVL